MPTTSENSCTGYVENIHKKMRNLETKCGSSESFHTARCLRIHAQTRTSANTNRILPTLCTQISFQENSPHRNCRNPAGSTDDAEQIA